MWYLDAQEVRRLGDHCVVPLSRYIESDRSRQTEDDRMKRREAARIVGDVATTWAIPELINLLGDADGDVRYPAAVALQRLTSQSLGRRPEEWRDQPLATCAPTVNKWRDWWEKNKDRFPGVDPNAVREAPVVKQRLPEKQKV
jgi:HEAT repeat protein